MSDILPHHEFDLTTELDDPRPFRDWVPCPEQIRLFALQIRAERGDLPHGDLADDESAASALQRVYGAS